MKLIYIGDSRNVINRIRSNHCTGNVEGSVLRKCIAERLGYRLEITIRPSGTRRIGIDLPNSSDGEQEVSNYIRSGKWKYVICDSVEEARDFKKYVIRHHRPRPTLNVHDGEWNGENENRYEELFEELNNAEKLTCENIGNEQPDPGVCVSYHEREP